MKQLLLQWMFLFAFLMNLSNGSRFRRACPFDETSEGLFDCSESDLGCSTVDFQDTCEDPNQVCCRSNCSFACKDPVYEKAFCPNSDGSILDGNVFPIPCSSSCSEDSDCIGTQICCPGTCNDLRLCKDPQNRKAECPDGVLEFFDGPPLPRATQCTSDSDCFEDEKLCCRFEGETQSYCRNPVFVIPAEP